ncbi:hypothetical protein GBAR_LOCUS22706, partial [Geodia barretti]
SRKSARPKALCHPKKESSLNVFPLVEGTLSGNTLNVIKYTVIPLEKAKNCKGTGEGGKDGEGSEGTKAPGDSEEPSSRSAGFQCHLFWPLLLLSLITLK